MLQVVGGQHCDAIALSLCDRSVLNVVSLLGMFPCSCYLICLEISRFKIYLFPRVQDSFIKHHVFFKQICIPCCVVSCSFSVSARHFVVGFCMTPSSFGSTVLLCVDR